MYCISCGEKFDEDDAFCSRCGIALQRESLSPPIKVPKPFTDASILQKKQDVLNQISRCEIQKQELEMQLDSARDHLRHSQDKQRDGEIKKREVERVASALWHRGNATNNLQDLASATAMRTHNMNEYDDIVDKAKGNVQSLQEQLSAVNQSLIPLKVELNKHEAALRLTETDRVENFYQELLDEMKTSKTGDAYKSLVRSFESLEGYKDSAQLAEKCKLVALEIRYNDLVQKKNQAVTEDEFIMLASEFRKISRYKDSAQLANECRTMMLEIKYNALINRKNNATTESQFETLRTEFRELNDYKDSAQLANECKSMITEIKYNALVQRKNNATTEAQFTALATEFRKLGGYKNSAQLVNECKMEHAALKTAREKAEDKKKLRERRATHCRKLALILAVAAIIPLGLFVWFDLEGRSTGSVLFFVIISFAMHTGFFRCLFKRRRGKGASIIFVVLLFIAIIVLSPLTVSPENIVSSLYGCMSIAAAFLVLINPER